MHPSLLVLAAGMGSRYKGLKQVDGVGPDGQAIIDYSVYDALRAGFGKIVFVIRKEFEEVFREKVSKKFEKKIEVHHVFQELDKIPAPFSLPPTRVKPWGTGHAILMGQEVITEPFAVINGDDFYGADSFAAMFKHLSVAHDTTVTDFSMVGFILKNTLSPFGAVSRGVCTLNEKNDLKTVNEFTQIEKFPEGIRYTGQSESSIKLAGDEIVSMNMWGFTPSIFAYLQEQFVDFLTKNITTEKGEFYIPTVVDSLIKTGKACVKVMKSADQWFGITYQEDKPFVVKSINELIRAGKYPRTLW